jgi:glycerol uptake facilitator-like aquaporin
MKNPGLEGVFASFFIVFSLFLVLVLGAPFTGGHFNPSVTFVCMLKK